MTLEHHPAFAELRGYVIRLALISHAPISAYGRRVVDAEDDIGGRRPPGSDVDRPRRDAPLQEWMDWRASCQRRTPDYFRAEVTKCATVARLEELRDEARETLEAWARTPLPVGQEPQPGDPQWKRFVAESPESAAVLASRYWNVGTGRPYTARAINKIRQQYRERAA